MKTYGEAAREMACAVDTARNYKISNAPLAANAARGMAYAIYITSKDDLNVSKLPSDHFFDYVHCLFYNSY